MFLSVLSVSWLCDDRKQGFFKTVLKTCMIQALKTPHQRKIDVFIKLKERRKVFDPRFTTRIFKYFSISMMLFIILFFHVTIPNIFHPITPDNTLYYYISKRFFLNNFGKTYSLTLHAWYFKCIVKKMQYLRLNNVRGNCIEWRV